MKLSLYPFGSGDVPSEPPFPQRPNGLAFGVVCCFSSATMAVERLSSTWIMDPRLSMEEKLARASYLVSLRGGLVAKSTLWHAPDVKNFLKLTDLIRNRSLSDSVIGCAMILMNQAYSQEAMSMVVYRALSAASAEVRLCDLEWLEAAEKELRGCFSRWMPAICIRIGNAGTSRSSGQRCQDSRKHIRSDATIFFIDAASPSHPQGLEQLRVAHRGIDKFTQFRGVFPGHCVVASFC